MNTERTARRTVLKGLVAGAAVAGWSAGSGSWVAAGATVAAEDLAPLPELDGTVEFAPDVLARFAGDFGRLVEATPTAVLRPGSARDIARTVRYARRHGLTIAVNGQSGSDPAALESHSTYGQATAPGGIVVDARSLATIHRIDPGAAVVDAGVTWAQVHDAALAEGQTPAVLTDFLPLSVGGTLSVGGFGGTSGRYGSQADTAIELTVVTGTGDLVRCSPGHRRLLFEATLAGAGQCALIVQATVRLVPAPTTATVTTLVYDDLDTYLADAITVLAERRADHQAGRLVPNPDGSGWRFTLELGLYTTPPAQPDRDSLLAGLRDQRAEAGTESMPYPQWSHRLVPVEQALTAGGFWAQPHPWASVFTPRSTSAELVRGLLAELRPEDLGAGLANFYPLPTAQLKRPLLRVPRHERFTFLLTLLRFPFPGQPDIAGLVAQNRRIYDLAVALGGTRNLIGSIDMTHSDWRRHYGPIWPAFTAAKAAFDPDRVLTPGQGIFA